MKSKKLMALCLASLMIVSSLSGCASSSSASQTDSTSEGTSGSSDESKDVTTTAGNDESKDETSDSGETKETDSEGTTAETTLEYTLDSVDPMSVDFSKYVDVSGWKEVKITKDDVTEDETSVYFAMINELMGTYGIEPKEVKDRAVETGDIANIDFKGYVDGEELENGADTGFDLTIGAHQFIEGFEDGVIGMKIGDEKTLDLHFPDRYPNNPDLEGKAVSFDVKLNGIKSIDTSAITDAEMKEASNDAYSSFEEFEKEFKNTRAEDYKLNTIWSKVMEEGVESKEVCKELSDDFINTYLYSFSIYASYFGMTVEEYLGYYNYDSIDAFKKDIKETADDYAKQTCAVRAIAEMENIKADKKAIDEKWNKILEEYENDEDAMKKDGYIYGGIEFDDLLEKVQSYISENIEIK